MLTELDKSVSEARRQAHLRRDGVDKGQEGVLVGPFFPVGDGGLAAFGADLGLVGVGQGVQAVAEGAEDPGAGGRQGCACDVGGAQDEEGEEEEGHGEACGRR